MVEAENKNALTKNSTLAFDFLNFPKNSVFNLSNLNCYVEVRQKNHLVPGVLHK